MCHDSGDPKASKMDPNRPSPQVHVDRATLRQFLLGDLDAAGSRTVVRHFLRGCRPCQELVAEITRGFQVPPEDDAKDRDRLARLLERVRVRQTELERERQEAPGLLVELERHPRDRQLTIVKNSRRFATVGFCELLLERCLEERFDDAHLTLDLARLATLVAERVDVERSTRPLAHDLRARAWAYVANALKILSDFQAADDALKKAFHHLQRGTGDPLERARVLDIKAALRSAQARTGEALRLLDRVINLYRRAGHLHSAGAALAQKGMVLGYRGDYDSAINAVRESLRLLDPEEDLKRFLSAWHNLAYLLHESGHLREALRVLRESLPFHDRLTDRLLEARRRWLEGKIALGLSHLTVAEHHFLSVRKIFIDQGIGYDAAEVSLELGGIYAREGRIGKLRDLAVAMVPIFEARDMNVQALAALLVFQKATENRATTPQLVDKILNFLRRSRHDPNLVFRP